MSEQNQSNPEIVKKSRQGFLSLSLRSVLTYGFQIVSTLSLAHFLGPKDYAIFGIINGWMGALNLYTDIGLGVALVQKSEELSHQEISAYFGVRLLLAFLMALVIYAFGPWIIRHYQLQAPYIEYARYVGFLMVIDVLSAPNRLVLSRRLEFAEIGKVEILASLGLYLTQIGLAAIGFGFWSFFAGMLVRGLTSFIAFQVFCPVWKWPSFNFSRLQGHYRFGVFTQLNSIIPATTAGLVIPYILNFYLSVEEIGYVFWVGGLVAAPVMFVFNYVHVFISSLSRLQDKACELKYVASRSIENMLLGLGFIFGLGGICSEGLVIFLFNPKWYPAIPLFPLAAFSTLLYGIRLLSASVATASGHPEKRTLTEVVTSLAELAGHILFCSLFGMGGYFLSKSVVFALALILMFYLVRSYLRREVFTRLIKVFAALLIAYFVIDHFHLAGIVYLSIPIFSAIYLGYLAISDPMARSDFRKLFTKLGLSS